MYRIVTFYSWISLQSNLQNCEFFQLVISTVQSDIIIASRKTINSIINNTHKDAHTIVIKTAAPKVASMKGTHLNRPHDP